MKALDRLVGIAIIAAALALAGACSQDPESAKRAHAARADRYVAENKLDEAVIEYLNAIKIDARYGEARYKLGEVYERQGNLQRAFGEYIRAAELLPGREDAQLKAAAFLLLADRNAEAKQIAEALLEKNPRNVDAAVIKANALAGLKESSAALAEFESAIQLDPKRVDTYVNLGYYQAMGRNFPDAEKVLQEALKVDPRSVNAHVGLARLYLASGDLPKAEASFKNAIAIEPANVNANSHLALLYVRSGRTGEAEAPLRVIAEKTKAVGARLALAQYYLAAKRSGEAVPLLNALTKEREGRTPATNTLAAWDYSEGRKEEAHKRLDQLLAQEPTNAGVLLLKAKFLAAEGRYDEAIGRLQAAATAAPQLAAVQLALGDVYLGKRDRDGALKAFTEALKLDPQSSLAAIQVARLQLSLGRPDLALATAGDLSRRQPTNLDARFVAAKALLAQPRPTADDVLRAETEAAALAAQAPRSADVQVLVGQIAGMKKDYAASRKAYLRAQELDAGSVPALEGLVALDIIGGKPADARNRIAARLASSPDRPEVLEFAGRAYMSLGDPASAEAALKKLVQLQPDNMRAFASLGQLYWAQKRLDQARAEFERYAQRDPNSIAAHTFIGMLLQLQNRNADAQKSYERVIAINPNAAVAANNLAWLYAEQGVKLDIALQLAQTAKSQLPDSHEVDDTLGWVYYKRGLAKLAVSSFERSVQRDPTNAGYLYHLGLAQLQDGDKVRARESMARALKTDANFPGAADARKILAGMD